MRTERGEGGGGTALAALPVRAGGGLPAVRLVAAVTAESWHK